MTFDVLAATQVAQHYDWQDLYETFCVCRHCRRSSIFIVSEKNFESSVLIEKRGGLLKIDDRVLNRYVDVQRYVSLKDQATVAPPDHLPENIAAVFKEGATCLAVQCYNAAGTMFRLCVDLTTQSMLPEGEVEGLSAKVRRSLGLRLVWLFDNGYLPMDLKTLSSCIKDDGNDGAHAGTLKREDAEDLLDFTTALLERIYTEPERLRLAKERRDSRRGKV